MSEADGDERQSGCFRAFQIGLALLLLLPIACCATINSQQLAIGFPKGIGYDRVLAYEADTGFREGCVFIAYRLSDESAARLASGIQSVAAVELRREKTGNSYTRYRPTPLTITDRHSFIDESGEHPLHAFGALGGCGENIESQPSADKLLAQPGNYFAVSQNGEGLSVISPARKIVLFLYFG